MSRPLKFRAWDEGLKYYFYDVAVYPNNAVAIQRHNIESAMLNAQYGATHWTELGESAVIEQYTGLKDKNGKEIYEGDMLQIDDHILGDFEVVWHNLSWKIKRSVGFESLSVHKTEDIVVIGNIHENGDLLNDAED